MDPANILVAILNTVLVAFTGLTWWVYRKLAHIEKENQKTRLDPTLMVVGDWTYNAPDVRGFKQCTGKLWLCNPGPTPLVVTRWNYTAHEPGGTIQVWNKECFKQHLALMETDPELSRSGPFPTWDPIHIPGYESRWLQVGLTAKGLQSVDFTYSTSMHKDMILSVDPR